MVYLTFLVSAHFSNDEEYIS